MLPHCQILSLNAPGTAETKHVMNDKSLRETDPQSGVRAFEDVLAAMFKNGFELIKDYEMPANNRMLYFRRLKFARK